MATNQKEIAEKLNLSVATVCRSLGGHPDVHTRTRKKVIELASRMGYQPASVFRRRNSSDIEKLTTVGVFLFWPEGNKRTPSSSAYHFLGGISSAAEDADVSMATHFLSPERCQQIADGKYQLPAMRAGALSGLVLVYDFPGKVVRGFADMLPCASLVHSHLDMGVDCIDNDHAGGVNMLMDHLYSLGHRRIGFLSAPNRRSWLFTRFAGYMQAINRLGLSCDPSMAVNLYEKPHKSSQLDMEAQADAVAEQVRRGVTAWVCADDFVGYNLYPRLVKRGLRIPRDVSIVGFSGLEPPQQNLPQLTTVHPPFERMGTAAVQRLLNRIKHPDEPADHIQFSCEFIKGQTTGPPAEQ